MADVNIISPKFAENVQKSANGFLPSGDDGSIDSFLVSWRDFKNLLNKSITAGSIFNNDIVSTYSLVYTVGFAYSGAVLAPNGDIHFVPQSANRGQKIDINGVVSTYSLVYTAGSSYSGGVLAPNGDIHFIPYFGNRGQKISSSGVVSTYSLVYTPSSAYGGGVLAPNGDIHFVPCNANRGQKISTTAVLPFDIGTCCSSFLNKL